MTTFQIAGLLIPPFFLGLFYQLASLLPTQRWMQEGNAWKIPVGLMAVISTTAAITVDVVWSASYFSR